MFCCHGNGTDHATPEELILSGAINYGGVECFNEAQPQSGRLALKQACSRQSKASFVESPSGDCELLLNVPFTSSVRLKGLCVSAGLEAGVCSRPLLVKLFANSSLDIGECREAAATQELTLSTPDEAAELWHNLKVAKFGDLHRLQLYFQGEQGEDAAGMRVYYVGLKAEVGLPRVGVVHATYEARAQLADHKQQEQLAGGSSLTQ